jgi:hypothetical protein
MTRPSYLGKPVIVFIFTSQMLVIVHSFTKIKGFWKKERFRVTDETIGCFTQFCG